MKANRLSGHILPNEGRLPRNYDSQNAAEGPAVCSCGATSEALPSASARKKWHREHKDEIRDADRRWAL